MEITWTALVLLVFFVTPGLPYFIGYRFLFPRIRTMAPRETSLYILCCVANLLSNWKLLSNILTNFINLYIASVPSPSGWKILLLKDICIHSDLHPWRPARHLWRLFGVNFSEDNLVGVVFDLHARCMIGAVVCLGIVFLIGKMVDRWDARGYVKRQKKSTTQAAPIVRGAIAVGGAKIQADLPNSNWFISFVQALREAIYHPWTYVTRNNAFREILMVDVLTTENGMYSGAFSSWIPDSDNNFSAVAIEYTLHYKPRESEVSQKLESTISESEKNVRGDRASEVPQGKNKKPPRKKRFIDNNGEIIIPKTSIANLHFWEIRKGQCLNVHIYHINDIETLKFYVTLAMIRKDIIQKIDAVFRLNTDEEFRIASAVFRAWMGRPSEEIKKILHIYSFNLDASRNQKAKK